MSIMRWLPLFTVLAAGPIAAQDFDGLGQSQLEDLRAQQQLAQQRAIAQENEIRALESRLRAELTVAEQQAARVPFLAPQPAPGAPFHGIDVDRLPSIPDRALADSNRRVRETVKNRR